MKLKFVILTLFALASCSKRPDFVVNDFEADTYGSWQSTGSAFGGGPSGSLGPGQSKIKGIRGDRAASSFRHGLASQGTLTSPQFKIERRYINFLAGGGDLPDSSGLQLFVDGKMIYQTTGNNRNDLDWQAWDLKEYHGKAAQIVIFDFAAGDMGYIIVDHIAQSDMRYTK